MLKVLQPLKAFAWRVREDSRRRRYLNQVARGNRWFDYWLGTDTSGIQTSARYSRRRAALNPKARYEPVNEGGLRTIIECLVPDPSEYSFFDIGSGKGKALIIAGNYPFKQVRGIELDQRLHLIAENNLAMAGQKMQRRCAEIRSTQADAVACSEYADHSVIFLFNSFQDDQLKRLVDRISEHARRNDGHTVLVCLTPTRWERIDSSSEFRELIRTPRLAVYGSDGYEIAPHLGAKLAAQFTGWTYVPGYSEEPENIIALYGQGPRGR